MNGLLDYWMNVTFRNCCHKNKSHSKMFGLLDEWMIRLKPALKKTLFLYAWMNGLLDYFMTSKLD